MKWVEQHYLQIALVAAAVILLTVGRAKLLPKVKSSRLLLWVAFLVTAVCGLIVGWALVDVMSWVTGLKGPWGAVIGPIGAVIAVAAGWWSIDMLVALIRDVADGVPDGEARRAALWLPTMAPAGLSAAWGIASNPRGIGTGIAAVVIAVITVVFAHRITKSALAARTGSKAWRWFAALVMLLAGIVMIPILAYADVQAAKHLEGWQIAGLRIIVGAFGLALAIAALVDIADWVPDAAARAFLGYGVPVLFLFGALAIAAISDGAQSGGELILGGGSR